MRRGFLATETPRRWCESQEGPCVQDGLAPFFLCARLSLSLSLWILSPPAVSPGSGLDLTIPPGRKNSLSNRQRTQSSPAFSPLLTPHSHLGLKRICVSV